jgi:peptidoglycan/LPS O-acetylase OafA/YrhL
MDAARAFAAFWVLACHALLYLEIANVGGVLGEGPRPNDPAQFGPLLSPSSNPRLRQILKPLSRGNLGVPIFFVISGFCIHWPAARGGRNFRFNLPYYIKRRFWRLYPTHFVAVCGSMLLAWLLWLWIEANGLGNCVQVPWRVWWAHFAMLQAQLPSTADWMYCYNPNLWTLETEFQLYGCYIVLLPLARWIGWRKVLFGTLAISLWWMYGDRSDDSIGWRVCRGTICLRHLFSWTIGAYVAECLCRRESPVHAIGWSVFAIAATDTLWVPLPSLTFMGAAIASAWVLWFLVKREAWEGETFKGCDWLGWWGQRSYSLYLWHSPILRVFVMLAAIQAPWIRHSYYYAYGLAVISALAALYVARFSYWAVERHFVNPASPISPLPPPALALQPS